MQARQGLRTNTWCMAARRPIIAGNWKMNPETVEEAVQLAKEIVEAAKTSKAQVMHILAPGHLAALLVQQAHIRKVCWMPVIFPKNSRFPNLSTILAGCFVCTTHIPLLREANCPRQQCGAWSPVGILREERCVREEYV